MNPSSLRSRVDRLAGRWTPVVVVALAGLMWLVSVNWKVPPDFGDTDESCRQLCGFVQAGVDHPVAPGSDWVLEEVVQPNFEVFGWLVLVSEVALATLLVSRRYLRTAAVLGLAQSIAIGLTVANAPDEWYWSYVLMAGLHIAVLAFAPGLRPLSARTMAVVAGLYGVVVALAHLEAGFTGDDNADWLVFAGDRDIPDELGRSLFPGSMALGLLLVAAGIGAWTLAETVSRRTRHTVGWLAVGVAAVLLVTYRDDGLAVGLGSKASTAAVLAALGLSLTAPNRSPARP